MKFEYYQDSKLEWRWTLKASNGLTVADGSEGYISKAHVLRALKTLTNKLYNAKKPLAMVARPVPKPTPAPAMTANAETTPIC